MKKTLANRRMFRQGGAVNSGPTGILASSPSLIDAVAQDAMNVQGGPTVRMAEGGIVRMANGGSIGDYLPTQNAPLGLRFPRSGRRIQLGFQVPEDERRARAGMTSEELMKLFPADASLEGGFLGAQRLRTEGDPSFFAGITKSPGTPLGEIASVPYAVFDQMARRLSREGTKAAQVVADVAEGLVTIRPEGKDYQTHFGQIMAVNDMVRRAPTVTGVSQEDIGAEIAELGKRIVAQEPDIPPDELKKYITGEIYTKYEGSVPIPGEGLDYEDVDMRPQDITGLEVDAFPEDPSQDDTLGEDDARGTPSIVPAVPKEGEVEPKASPKSGGAFNEGVDTVMGPSDEFEDPNAMKRRTETPGVGAEAVKQIKDAAKSGNEEETKNKLEDYINEFKSAIPEYEGKSEAEKGFDLVKMGMAVAAGESPEAITNISKGVLATIDNFTEDEKAKRAYKQQVAMSAAKYGLQRVAKDRDNALALAKEGRKMPYKLIANKDFEFEGRKIKKGQAFPLTRNQIDAGLLQDLPLTYEDSYVSDAKANLAAVKASLKGRVNATSFNETKKQYLTDLDDFKSGIRMKGVLREAAKIAADPNSSITGIGGVFKDAIDSSLNAMGIQGDERGAFLRKFASTDRKNYNAKQRQLGTLMATKLLREGSKTLSDFDRQRVDELIGLMVGTGDTLFASDEVLKMKLIELEKSIEAGIQGSANSLRMTEELFNNEITKGGTSIAAVLQRTRQRGLGEASGAALRSSKQGRILVSDIYDFKTKKFKPSYLRGES